MTTVYLVAQHRDPWEVRGIFTTKAKAVEHCTEEDHAVMLFDLDVDQGIDTSVGDGWYPLLETEEQGRERVAKLAVGGGVT